MNYQCIPSPNAEILSELVQRLSRPVSIRVAGELTTQRWVNKDGTNGTKYLVVPADATMTVHAKAVPGEIPALLAGYVTSGFLTKSDLDGMTAAIEAARGTGVPVRVWDLIPGPFKAQARSFDDLVEQGIFTQPSTPPHTL